jgi:excisionase family DNA binding protein
MREKRERVFTTFQIAEMCSVRPTTVIKWANQQRIKAYTTPGGHRRVLESDFLEFLKKYNLPIPLELGAGRRRILVVEDEADLGQLLVRSLQRASKDLDVRWTRDGVEALLDIGKNPPDLVLLDVAMPLVDGTRVLATLRSDPKTQGVKVIGMTGQRLTNERLEAFKKNSHAFFLKPFKMADVLAAALDLLGLLPDAKLKTVGAH